MYVLTGLLPLLPPYAPLGLAAADAPATPALVASGVLPLPLTADQAPAGSDPALAAAAEDEDDQAAQDAELAPVEAAGVALVEDVHTDQEAELELVLAAGVA